MRVYTHVCVYIRVYIVRVCVYMRVYTHVRVYMRVTHVCVYMRVYIAQRLNLAAESENTALATVL